MTKEPNCIKLYEIATPKVVGRRGAKPCNLENSEMLKEEGGNKTKQKRKKKAKQNLQVLFTLTGWSEDIYI